MEKSMKSRDDTTKNQQSKLEREMEAQKVKKRFEERAARGRPEQGLAVLEKLER
jgi:predicted DNA-binding WGR domain protein